MKFRIFNDVTSFYRDTFDVMMRHEAQNLIPLGNLIIGIEGKDKTDWRDPAAWFMAAVTDSSGIRLTAIMTPPFNLTLYATDNHIDDEAVSCLVEGIEKADVALPGVLTEKKLALQFADSYSKAKNIKYTIAMENRIYELTKVNPEINIKGALRLARESDMSFLPYWIEGFNFDCFGKSSSPKSDPVPYHYFIETGKLYILEDNGMPVTMTQINREMRNVCGVSYVYTPPYFRRKGYATSCVAGVSRIILEKGFTKCALYTDLANPTSNSIYQKIGYVPVCDSLEIKFG
jgi:RimJ/RimL family protein N-acetyltransferase